jgi:hypothetical protein
MKWDRPYLKIMQISSQMLQTYFLGVHPRDQEVVARGLNDNAPGADDQVTKWHVFARLASPGIVALREVSRSSGLDIFLLDVCRLPGVEDVAEFMSFDFEPKSRLQEVLNGEGSLFMTFIRLNWDGLASESVWGNYGMALPIRSSILDATVAVLRAATTKGKLRQAAVKFCIQGGVGDCDLLVIGRTQSRRDMDVFLMTLTQLGTDNLARELGGEIVGAQAPLPICAASTTELSIPWEIYSAALQNGGAPDDDGNVELDRRIDSCLGDGLRAAIQLRRARSSLAGIRDSVRNCVAAQWQDNALLGEADILLKWEGPAPTHHLSDLVRLMAALDNQAARDEDFPRRFSAVISFDPDGKLIERQEVFGEPLPPLPNGSSQAALEVSTQGLDESLAYLLSIRDSRMREELRIVERMVERCVILQRHADLPRETRRLARLGLYRIGRTIKRLSGLAQGVGTQVSADSRLRLALVNSGHHLDRTLSHLARGSIPLLLSSAAQARTTDHFASETLLASALGVPASAVAKRLRRALSQACPPNGEPPSEYQHLMESLDDMSDPIIYVSHELNFKLIRPLCIVHVPRWVMWYPTASSFVLHELGHAVLGEGQFTRLLAFLCLNLETTLSPPAKQWCQGVTKRGRDALAAAESDSSDAWEDWASDRSEDGAEFFHRLFAYPAKNSATSYLQDWLEYQYSETQRRTLLERRSLLVRTFTVHIAMDLVGDGTELWTLREEEVLERLRFSMRIFDDVLKDCMSGKLPPFHQVPYSDCPLLRSDITELSQGILFALENDLLSSSYPEDAISGCVEHAMLLALAVTSINGVVSDEKEAFLCQTLWKAALHTAFDGLRDDTLEQEKHLLEEIEQGIIPPTLLQRPELLPRMLHSLRRREGKSVTLNQRLALSLCLADWARANTNISCSNS